LLIIIALAIILGIISNQTELNTENNTFIRVDSTYQNNDVETSRGYSTDPNYKPTVTPDGKYHTIDGKARQRQYQRSKEQKEHLDEMDRRGW